MVVNGKNILEFCTAQSRRSNYYRMILIVIFGALAYSNTLSAPFSFDDSANIANNPQVMNSGFSGMLEAFTSRRAIGIISFQLNHLLFGWNVLWYHLTNISIHLAVSLTLYRFLQLLMQTPYMAANSDDDFRGVPLPLFAALLFVAHPVQTQAVTYIVQRFASLATLFYLAATLAYLKARLCQHSSAMLFNRNVIGWFMACILSTFLAFYTKETAFTLPMAVLLVELLFFSAGVRKICLLTVAGSAVVAGMLLRYASAGQTVQNAITLLDEATRVQTIIPRADYLFTQFRVIMTYVRLLFLPVRQRLDYDYVLSRTFFEWRVFCSFLVIIALLLTALWLVKKSRDGYPYLRLTAFGIMWFFLTLTVESSLIPIIDLIFEHRLYLPSCGAIIAVTAAVLGYSWQRGRLSRELVCALLLLIATVLAVVTFNRNSVWRSEVTLWSDCVEKSPDSARAWHQLGAAYIVKREPLNALKATVRSIELDRSRAAAWNNLGIALDLFGAYNDRFHRTAEMFREPEAINEKNTNLWQGEVNNNLGLAYEILGNLDKADENYRNAVGYNPALGLAYYNLAIVSAKTGDAVKYSAQKQILWMLDPALADRLQFIVEKR